MAAEPDEGVPDGEVRENEEELDKEISKRSI
jgi:hypothetical protein